MGSSQALPLDVRTKIYELGQRTPRMSNRAIASVLNISDDAVGKYRNQKPAGGIVTPISAVKVNASVKPVEAHTKHEETRTESTRSLDIVTDSRITSLDELIDYCDIDLTTWEVERIKFKSWEVTCVPRATRETDVEGWVRPDNTPVTIPMFGVQATFKLKKNIVDARAEIEALKEEAKTFSHPAVTISRTQEVTGNLLEVAIFDHHFGKLGWKAQTRDKNYDLAIAEAVYFRALDHLIGRAQAYKYDRILFIVGQDLLHFDGLEGKTTKGTPMDIDGRYQKVFTTARRAMVASIEKLRLLAPVDVIVVPGNHDSLSSWAIGDSLECWFHAYEDVVIDNEPVARKYYSFGDVLLMFTHGHKGVHGDYGIMMATEQPALFAASKFREVHTGHLHQQRLTEKFGIRVRILSSLTPSDWYHSENGYIGMQKVAEAMVWNKKEGLVAQFFYNDSAFPELFTKRVLYEAQAA
jgi:hypothetical protein